jgi:hypothetical protein
MMDAFSNARDVWVVGLVVNASFLVVSSVLEQTASIPSEGNFDLGKPQFKQFKLTKVLVQQIPSYLVSLLREWERKLTSLVTPCTSHCILSTSSQN